MNHRQEGARRVLRRAALSGALLLTLFVASTGDVAACATCVSASECETDDCEGSMACSFDGPLIETETEIECNFVTRLIFGCRASFAHRVPSCRTSGGPCWSMLPQCKPGTDLDPDILDPQSPGDDDEEGQFGR